MLSKNLQILIIRGASQGVLSIDLDLESISIQVSLSFNFVLFYFLRNKFIEILPELLFLM